ncbi:TRADD-N-associated membrane domain-containing protein [Chryseobacterium sp. SIMBA_038]|uniref:TRADD-N-associated membrane domain-containing protein n=1 Tax=Chryseobacterium sp. SIMBA_038 TaxID=3085780 RepID=UPI00397A4FDB
MKSDIFNLLIASFATLVTIIGMYLSKNKIDRRSAVIDEKEIKEEIDKVVKLIDEGDKNVLNLMIKNVAELKEYYVMNKQQARNSFSAALITCFLGFIVFIGGIIISYFNPASLDQNVIPYTTIAGGIVEVVSGLFFWLYSKAITQINLFHASLQSTEKFLTAIQLVEKISVEKRDEVYRNIIDKIISFNFSSMKEHKKDN